MKLNFYRLKYLQVLMWILGFSAPVLVYAFSLRDSTFRSFILQIISVIGVLIPILFAIAFIVFFWGLSKFILNSDNEKDIQNGKNYMFWGVLALFILISFRAIIGLVSNELEFGNSSTVPLLPTGASSNPTVEGGDTGGRAFTEEGGTPLPRDIQPN